MVFKVSFAAGRVARKEKQTKHQCDNLLPKIAEIIHICRFSGLLSPTSTITIQKWPPGAPPGASGELPGSIPGGLRGPQETPRAPQDGPKSRQERPKSCPEAVPERPGRALGADLAPKSPQEGSRRRFLPPRGSIVGSCEARFGLLPALFGERFPQRQSTGLIAQIGALGALAQEPPTELPGLLHEWGRRQGRSL